MAILSDEVKRVIVERIAAFQGYDEIARDLSREGGIEVSRFQVRTYDPTNAKFAGGDKWRAVFEAARERYLGDLDSIPISHAAFRLNQLNEMFFESKRAGDYRLACSILRQAAAESARAVPKSESGNAPDLTDFEDRRARAREILEDIIGRARALREAA